MAHLIVTALAPPCGFFTMLRCSIIALLVLVSTAGQTIGGAEGDSKTLTPALSQGEREEKADSTPTRFAGTPVPATYSFELDVMPILTARGCNQGACHGKARGQNGFQLSLLGFDADFDYAALTQQARGRRVFPAAPERSLVLQKATAELPHGGGVRIEAGSPDYDVLLKWIAQGTPRRVENEPKLVSVSLETQEKFLKPGEEFRLVVTAGYSDGSKRDVTSRTQFQSSEAGIVGAQPGGIVKAGLIPGEATIMARYMYVIAVCHVAIPLPGSVADAVYADLPRQNFIDEQVWTKLQSLSITPSPQSDDANFLRRVHLDIIGRLPTPDEVRVFLASSSSNKRRQVVQDLLNRPEYADHWAAKWADLLRPNPYRVGIKAVVTYDAWIRESFRRNKPYDQFVRELITAQGSTFENGASVMFRDRREPTEITTLVSQLFLGIRLECAKCHHHPFEKYGQDDFYSFAAYFARLGFKGTGLSPPISGSEEIVLLKKTGSVEHPLTRQTMQPRPLFGEASLMKDDVDPREALAAWITSDENPYFAKVIVNRVWADLMGRGLVEPVDDLRATNPPTNGPLLEALAADFRAAKYDLKHLIHAICTSHVYGLSSLPTERNVGDRQNYSRHYRTRLRGEVLLDAVSDITGIADTFSAMPAGSRANQLWTTRVQSVFLDTFGRPNPNQDPPCERTSDTTVTQTLHLMNAPLLHSRVTADGSRAAQLAASDATPDTVVEELYLYIYSRLPDAEEREIGRQLFAEKGTTRRQAAEDLIWALLNTPEFIFKD
jgi:Protein of unknown function (DUF1549)/Protein of unknown function (DUF1553)